MDQLLTSWLARGGFLPHGYCLTWSPTLLWSMVGADALIAASYYSIPIAIVSFTRRRRDLQFNWVLMLFSAFIFSCGTTHVMDIWTLWQPDYALQTLTKIVTAAVSVVTALALWPLIPKALRIPSVAQLQSVIDSLEAEVRLRRSTQGQLAEIEQALAATLASIGAGFISTDRSGAVVRMNEVAATLTGWSQDEARGVRLWTVFHRQDRPPEYLEKSPVDVVMDTNIAVDTVQRVTCLARDGSPTVVEVRCALTHAPDGSVQGLAMIFRDIGRLERAEAESSRLAAIVESSQDAIIGKTLDGQISSWNQGAEDLFGYTADEAIGRPVELLIPPERAGEENRIRADLAKGDHTPAFNTVRRARDGRLLDVSVTVSPIRDMHGRIVGGSMIARDITREKLAEASRLKAVALETENRQIQEASRLKSEFLANMSHELRTPLNAIIGFADLLQMGKIAPGSPKQTLFVDHIRSSGRHLLQLINDVLDLSKVEAGKLEFYPEVIDPAALAGDIVAVLHGQAVVKSIGVGVRIGPGLERISIDPQRLKQVLFNYLSNALKFTPSGGSVTVRGEVEDDDWWRLEVEDTGLGIRPEDIPRLFTEFQQLDGGLTKAHPGTGLGLALTRRLVEAQGGTVGVRSVPGVGSVFFARLLREAARPSPNAVTAGLVAPTLAPARAVLVIEAEPQDAERLVSALAGAGFGVAVARTAAEALALSRKQRFCAITLDLVLPDRSGVELLADIRASGLNRDVPVLIVTLLRQPMPLDAFPVADVLSKPIDGAALVRALQRIGVTAPNDNVVMVIDDDLASRDLMMNVLVAEAYSAVSFASAEAAFDALEALRPAAVILDLSMPGMDGFEFLERLRDVPAWRSLPVLVWTSRDLAPRDHLRLSGKAQAVLGKGDMDIERLLGHVREFVDGGRADP